ncbi:MAG: hypothetical protein LBH77_02840 [Tannerella sp.]|jgi:hypothetical protein|nr:hypothetical protein [Tannerella sp.]
MKNLLLLCIGLVLFTGKGSAQNHLNLRRLNKEELKYEMSRNAPQLYRQYRTGSTLSGVGMGLTLGGIAAIVIGVATGEKETVTEGGQTTLYIYGAGGGIAAIGTACALAGTPLWIIGNVKKKKARNRYIRDYSYDLPGKPSPYLQLNAVRNGMGLAYVF